MKTSSCKAKGRLLQQKVVAKILEYFPHLTARDVQSRPMGSQGTDVMLSETAFKAVPFGIECKAQEVNKSLINAWNQTKENSKDGHPLLVISANRSPVLAVVELDTFLAYMKASGNE